MGKGVRGLPGPQHVVFQQFFALRSSGKMSLPMRPPQLQVLWQCRIRTAWPPAGELWSDYLPQVLIQIETWWLNFLRGGPPVLELEGGWRVIVVSADLQVVQESPLGRRRPMRRVVMPAGPRARL